MFILSMLILLFSSTSTPFCSCGEAGEITEEKYKAYDLVLRGEIVKIEPGEVDKTLIIRVKTLYKGENKSDLLEIKTPSLPGHCGLNAGPGDEWLFFAFSDAGKFSTNICTRSKNLDPDNYRYRFQKEEIENDLLFLEEYKLDSNKKN